MYVNFLCLCMYVNVVDVKDIWKLVDPHAADPESQLKPRRSREFCSLTITDVLYCLSCLSLTFNVDFVC